jgi:hypothetical protein
VDEAHKALDKFAETGIAPDPPRIG